MTGYLALLGSALWLGVLTSISPCPLATNIAAVSFVGQRVGNPWKVLAAGGLYALGRALVYAGLCLALVPVFCFHASDNIWTMVRVFNRQKRFPENRGAILRAMQPEAAAARRPVFLTNLSLPEARRLPGVVWFDPVVFANDVCSDRLAPLYTPGRAREFIREARVTHLALRSPAEAWLQLNAPDLSLEPVYTDDMVWIGRVRR